MRGDVDKGKEETKRVEAGRCRQREKEKQTQEGKRRQGPVKNKKEARGTEDLEEIGSEETRENYRNQKEPSWERGKIGEVIAREMQFPAVFFI